MHQLKEEINIKDMIYEIRGKEVMLDSDLAKLYGCKNGTKEINQAVKNNLAKFPERYCWKLNKEEFDYLRSKFLTSKKVARGGRQYLPYVFTEQGIYMLATILKTKEVTNVTLKIKYTNN